MKGGGSKNQGTFGRSDRFVEHKVVERFLKNQETQRKVCGEGVTIVGYIEIPQKVDGSTQSRLSKIKLSDGRVLFVKQTAEKSQVNDQLEAVEQIKTGLGKLAAQSPFIFPLYSMPAFWKNGVIVYPIIEGQNLFELYKQNKVTSDMYGRIGAALSKLHIDGMKENNELDDFYASDCDLTGKSLLVHDDLNSTNIMLTNDGKIYFVDIDGIKVKRSESYRNIKELWADVAHKDPEITKVLIEGYLSNFLPEKQPDVLKAIRKNIGIDLPVLDQITFPLKIDLSVKTPIQPQSSPKEIGGKRVDSIKTTHSIKRPTVLTKKENISPAAAMPSTPRSGGETKERSVMRVGPVKKSEGLEKSGSLIMLKSLVEVQKFIEQLSRDKENIRLNQQAISFGHIATALNHYVTNIKNEEDYEKFGELLGKLTQRLAVNDLADLKNEELNKLMSNYRKKKMQLAAGWNKLVRKEQGTGVESIPAAVPKNASGSEPAIKSQSEQENVIKNNFEQLLRERVIELPSFVKKEEFIEYLLGRKQLDDFASARDAKRQQRRQAADSKLGVSQKQLLSELQSKFQKLKPEDKKELPPKAPESEKDKELQLIKTQSQLLSSKKKLSTQPSLLAKTPREEVVPKVNTVFLEKRLLEAAGGNLIGINKPLQGNNGVVKYLLGEAKKVEERTIASDEKFKKMIAAERQAGQAVQNKAEFVRHLTMRFPRIKTDLGGTPPKTSESQESSEPPEALQKEYERLYALCKSDWKEAAAMTDEAVHRKALKELKKVKLAGNVSLTESQARWFDDHHLKGKVISKPKR